MEAVHLLEGSETAAALLGEDLVNDVIAFARSELRTYLRRVTDWEREAYLEQV